MRYLKQTGAFLKRVTPRHWAWFHFKISLGIGWGTAIFFLAPPSIRETVDSQSIAIWSVGTILGALISSVGIFMTVSRRELTQIWGLGIEMVGIVLLAGGPLQYFIIQVSYLAQGMVDQRYALSWFAYSMMAAIAIRVVIILPQFINIIRAIREEEEARRGS